LCYKARAAVGSSPTSRAGLFDDGKRASKMLAVDDAVAIKKSRLVALRIAILSLRLMENWRRPFKDFDSALILLAVAAIGGEKLTRSELEADLQDLAKPIARDRLTPCNINSIAEATGINRETARRKVKRLAEAGLLETTNGSIHFSRGFSQREEPNAILRSQLETLRWITNDLIRDGVFADAAE
jgi:hypothetical protein